MDIVVHLPDDVAARLLADAERRGQAVGEFTADLLARALPARGCEEPDAGGEDTHVRRPLAFAAIGASGDRRGGAEGDELSAEGFGRD